MLKTGQTSRKRDEGKLLLIVGRERIWFLPLLFFLKCLMVPGDGETLWCRLRLAEKGFANDL